MPRPRIGLYLTAKVCEVGVEVLRGTEAVPLHNLQEEQRRASGEAARFVKDTLALRLAGQACYVDQRNEEQTAGEGPGRRW